MLVLTVANGPDRGSVFELRDQSRVVIGRNSPDLKLNDIMISRYHARLKLSGGQWAVRDLGSRNGTKLNGHRLLKPTVLKTGDRIVTGYTEFVVALVPDAADAKPQAAPSQRGGAVRDAGPVEAIGAASSSEVLGEIAGHSSDDLIEAAAAASGELTEHREDEAGAAAQSPQADEGEDRAAPTVSIVAPLEEAMEPEEPEAGQEEEEDIAPADAPPTVAAAVHSEPAAPIEPAPRQVEEVTAAKPAIAAAKAEAQPVTAKDDGMYQPAEIVAPVITRVTVIDAPRIDLTVSLPAPVVAEAPPAAEAPMATQTPAGERPASEWMSAIESQIVVVEQQGWDDKMDEDDEDGFVVAAGDDDVEELDDDRRSLLYFDEDDHWADDVQLDDDELINSLQEDGPAALLAEDARAVQPVNGSAAQPALPPPAKTYIDEEPVTVGVKAKKKRRR